MSIGWKTHTSPFTGRTDYYRRVFPKKGFGVVWPSYDSSRMPFEGRYQWSVHLYIDGGGSAFWSEGGTDALEEAKRIVEDAFELIGEVDE